MVTDEPRQDMSQYDRHLSRKSTFRSYLLSARSESGYESVSSDATNVASTTQATTSRTNDPTSCQEFTQLCHTIGDNIQKMLQGISSMERMVDLLCTKDDNIHLREQLHQLQHTTHQLARSTHDLLKELSTMLTGANCTSSDRRKKRLIRDRLTGNFSDVLKRLQETQRQAAQKERESFVRASLANRLSWSSSPPKSKAGSKSASSESSTEEIREENPSNAPEDEQSTRQESAIQEMESDKKRHAIVSLTEIEERVNSEELRDRQQSILKIESDMEDVNHMFLSLSHMGHHTPSIEVTFDVGGWSSQGLSPRRRQSCLGWWLLVLAMVGCVGLGLSVYYFGFYKLV